MQFRYEPGKHHLLVVAGGPFDAAGMRAAWAEILRICAEHQLHGILFDGRAIDGVVPIAERFGLAELVADARPPRMAVLVTRDNVAYTKTFENAAVNRGASVKTTDDEAEARRFLGIT